MFEVPELLVFHEGMIKSPSRAMPERCLGRKVATSPSHDRGMPGRACFDVLKTAALCIVNVLFLAGFSF